MQLSTLRLVSLFMIEEQLRSQGLTLHSHISLLKRKLGSFATLSLTIRVEALFI